MMSILGNGDIYIKTTNGGIPNEWRHFPINGGIHKI